MPAPRDSNRRATDQRAVDRLEHHDRPPAMRALKPSERDAL
jgi:hypothetical protein